MAASIQTVREKMDVKETPNNKGLICTIRVTAYDNGVLEGRWPSALFAISSNGTAVMA